MPPETKLILFEVFAFISSCIALFFYAWVYFFDLDNSSMKKGDWKNTMIYFFTLLSIILFITGFIYFGYSNKSFDDISSFFEYTKTYQDYFSNLYL